MKTSLVSFGCLILTLAAPLSARADEASHRALAAKVVEITGGDKALHGALPGLLNPMLERMRQQGISNELAQEAKDAVTKWFDREIKWEDVKPQIVDIYMTEYSEEELKGLLKFFQTDLGTKFISHSSTVMQKTAMAMQAYFQTKQASIQFALAPVIEKARAAAGTPPATPASPAFPASPATPRALPATPVK